MTDQQQPDPDDGVRLEIHQPTYTGDVADLQQTLLDLARKRTMGPAGTTDPRAALIRTDPGRHAANRGPAYGTPAQGGPVLPEGWTTMNLGPGNGWQPPAGTRIPAALIHRCPEPPESHEGWWFSVGLGTGVVLSGLLLLVVTLW